MCQITPGSDTAGIAPYVSISIRKRRGGYEAHMCQITSGKRRGLHAAHMCQFLIRERRGVYNAICVILLSGSGAAHMCQFISGSAAYSSICVKIFAGKRRGVYNAICVILLSGSGASLTQFNYLLASL